MSNGQKKKRGDAATRRGERKKMLIGGRGRILELRVNRRLYEKEREKKKKVLRCKSIAKMTIT